MRVISATLLTLLSVLIPGSAFACSVTPDYRVPTNFELVQRADVIALVRIESGRFDYHGGDTPMVKVRPVTFLKGSAPPLDLRLEGLVGWEGRAVQPLVTSLAEAHYSVSFGMCIRQLYPVGGLVLAFYERVHGKLQPIAAPFSRGAEDVSGPDDLWVRAARHYLTLQAGDPTLLVDRLKADQAVLWSHPDAESQAIAIDLADYLALVTDASRAPHWAIWTSDPEVATVVAPFLPGDDRLAELDCSVRRAPAVHISPPNNGALAIRIGSEIFATRRGAAIHDAPQVAVGDIVAPAKMIARIRMTADRVAILIDGHVFREGVGGDAFLRWAQRCQTFRHCR